MPTADVNGGFRNKEDTPNIAGVSRIPVCRRRGYSLLPLARLSSPSPSPFAERLEAVSSPSAIAFSDGKNRRDACHSPNGFTARVPTSGQQNSTDSLLFIGAFLCDEPSRFVNAE